MPDSAGGSGMDLTIVLMGDDLPLPENRVTLSETLVDSSGLPAPKIDYQPPPQRSANDGLC